MQEQIIRAALYPRVSSEEQVMHGHSLQAQEDALIDYANAHNMKIVGIYRDEGNSARKPALKRPVMLELLDDVKDGKIDRILFIKLDRWFRNVREYHRIQEILEQHHVAWQATMEDYNTATADGRLKVNIMLSVAENEADRTSERIKFIFNSKLQKKEVFFPKVPLGYKIDKSEGVKRLVKDPETEALMNEFFRISLAYNVRRAIVSVEENYGVTRCLNAWRGMVQNELYTGTLKGVENFCPAYITREEFNKLNSFSNIRKAQHNRIYLFTGLITCPCCGHRLTSKSTKSGGKEYYYYRCANHSVKKCEYGHQISELIIEQYLLENVRESLENYILSFDVSQKEPKKKQKKKDSVKLTERLRRINVAFFEGNITDEEYSEAVKTVKAELEKAKASEVEETPADLDSLREFLETDFETIYETLDKEDKRRLWRSVIDTIEVEGLRPVSIKFKR